MPEEPARAEAAAEDWRRDLRQRIAWALLAKLLALCLLWFCFFRRTH